MLKIWYRQQNSTGNGSGSKPAIRKRDEKFHPWVNLENYVPDAGTDKEEARYDAISGHRTRISPSFDRSFSYGDEWTQRFAGAADSNESQWNTSNQEVSAKRQNDYCPNPYLHHKNESLTIRMAKKAEVQQKSGPKLLWSMLLCKWCSYWTETK